MSDTELNYTHCNIKIMGFFTLNSIIFHTITPDIKKFGDQILDAFITK